MSLRDFRCLLSGVGLVGNETAAVLLGAPVQPKGDEFAGWRPVALPLFGVYVGTGLLEDVHEGPNVELLVEAAQRDLASGDLKVDWAALGVSELPLDHWQGLVGVLVAATLHAPNAIVWRGLSVGVAFTSAHVLAGLMEQEPEGEVQKAAVDALPELVVGSSGPAPAIYGQLHREPIRIRCRFGLSFAGLASVDQWLASQGGQWALAGPAEPFNAEAQREWAGEALRRAAQDEVLLAALQDLLLDQAEP